MEGPTHRRIRMFNTRDTYPNQALDNDLSQAVVAGDTVYLRGQVGTDFDGNLVGLGDPERPGRAGDGQRRHAPHRVRQ